MTGCPPSVLSNVWQSRCDAPSFTWNGATDSGSGVASYQGSWDSANIDRTSTAYNPGTVGAESSTTLQIAAVDSAGNVSPGATLFTLKYDGTAPTVPSMTTEPTYTESDTNKVFWLGGEESGVGGLLATEPAARPTPPVPLTPSIAFG